MEKEAGTYLELSCTVRIVRFVPRRQLPYQVQRRSSARHHKVPDAVAVLGSG